MKRLFVVFIVFFIISWTQIGCNDSSAPEVNQPPAKTTENLLKESPDHDRAVKGTVIMYTGLLSEGYAQLNMGKLARAAGAAQTAKVYHHMAAMGEGGVKMLSGLKKIEFGVVDFLTDESAEVSTTENWEYSYYKIATGEKKYENEVFYRLVYQLKKQEDHWLVEDVRVIESKEGPGKGELSFLTRPSDIPHQALSPDQKKGAQVPE